MQLTLIFKFWILLSRPMTNANLNETPPPALPRREQVSMFVDTVRNTTPPVIPEKGHRHTAIMGTSSPIHTATADDEPAPLPPKKEPVLPPKPKPNVNFPFSVSLQLHFTKFYDYIE